MPKPRQMMLQSKIRRLTPAYRPMLRSTTAQTDTTDPLGADDQADTTDPTDTTDPLGADD